MAAKTKKTGRRIAFELMLATRCEKCGEGDKTVTYNRVTRTGSAVRTTRCISCM